MAYMISTHRKPNANGDAEGLEPPKQGYAPVLMTSPRTDEVVVVWQNPDVTCVEMQDGDLLADIADALRELGVSNYADSEVQK